MPELVQQLPDGPIDFIGDVHGELEALQQLLSHLGYQTDGTHPEGDDWSSWATWWIVVQIHQRWRCWCAGW